MTASAVLTLVLLAAILQRITGMGAALMMAPFLVVFLGPHGGVMLTHVLAGSISVVMLASVWRRIEWRRLGALIPAAVLVMPLAGWLAARSPSGPLYIIVSCLVLAGLILAVFLARLGHRADGPGVRILTGIGAGAGTVLAGVGGPAMAFYQVLSQWDPRAFAASVQPVWITLSIFGLGSKVLFSGEEFPLLPWWVWVACLPLTVGGLRLGGRVGPLPLRAHREPYRGGRRLPGRLALSRGRGVHLDRMIKATPLICSDQGCSLTTCSS